MAGCLLALLLWLIAPAVGQGQPQDPVGGSDPVSGTRQAADSEMTGDGTVGPLDIADGRFLLCLFVALATAVCTGLLIHYTFSKSVSNIVGISRTRIALYMIVVALVVEAVLICAILELETKRYEAIYAAIIGYVLGSLGKEDKESDRAPGAAPVSGGKQGRPESAQADTGTAQE